MTSTGGAVSQAQLGLGSPSSAHVHDDSGVPLVSTSAQIEVTAVLHPAENVYLPWNDPRNVISFHAYILIATVSNTLAYPALFLVGFPTNVISMAVFWKQGLGDRMNVCLFLLAAVDVTYLTTLMAQASSSFLTLSDRAAGSAYSAYSLVFCLGVGWGLKTASGCVSMVVAVERCLCVALPLRAESLLKARTMALIILAIVLATQAAYVVQPVAYIVVRVVDDEGAAHWNIVTSDVFARHKVLVNVLLVVLLPVVVPLVTFVVMSVTTAITVVKLQSAMHWRERNAMAGAGGAAKQVKDRRKLRQTALTKMLVLLSCVHIVFTAPLMAVTFTRLVVPDFSPDGPNANICIAAHILGTVVTGVNSSVNFFVYYQRSSKFRSVMKTSCYFPCSWHKMADNKNGKLPRKESK